MSRLIINLFFIIVICFSLSILPINTVALNLFDFDNLLSTEDDIEIIEPIEIVDELFIANYDITFSLDDSKRIYSPNNYQVILNTNITENIEQNFSFEDLKLNFYKNEELYKSFMFNDFVTTYEKKYSHDLLQIIYEINLDYDYLKLQQDGFYTIGFSFTSSDKSAILKEKTFDIAYRNKLDYVTNGETQNNGNFIYKAFFLNEDKTQLVPLYFSVPYPESITVEVRNRLYNIPPTNLGLSQSQVIPSRANIAKLDEKYYGVFLYSNEIPDTMKNENSISLMTSSLIQSLTRLPHIDRLSFFLDDVQIEGSLYGFDLTKIYEEPIQSYVYLTEATSTGKNYLMPFEISEDNIYDEVWTIFNILKSGEINNKRFTEIIPPEVKINNFVIDGTTITVDFNENILTAYEDLKDYRTLMINSILYSLTSIENINKVSFTVNNEPITFIGNFDFSEPVNAPPYINFIGEF